MTQTEPLIIDVRTIPKPQRHPLIFDAMEQLAVGESLVVLNDHNPVPLRGQVETIYTDQFEWKYLSEGPDEFRLQFTRRALAPEGWQRPASKQSTLPMIQPQTSSSAIQVDLLQAIGSAHSGPQWAHESEDLDVTLLSWEAGKRIEAHVNNEVDVIWVGVAGEGFATVNGTRHTLRPGVALLIPKGCERAVESTAPQFSYLSVHRRRRGLVPTIGGRPVS
jgi:uncharacterized protein (DUF2249 family)/quercetin dioxygenase-like cupin family protein